MTNISLLSTLMTGLDYSWKKNNEIVKVKEKLSSKFDIKDLGN